RNAVLWVTWPGGSLSRVGRAERRSFPRLPCPLWLWKESVLVSKVRRPMSSSSRRFEILLPLRFNDGQPVPDDLIADTLLELRQQFGAVSSETQIIRGIWEHQGQSYRDDLVRVLRGRGRRPRKPAISATTATGPGSHEPSLSPVAGANLFSLVLVLTTPEH